MKRLIMGPRAVTEAVRAAADDISAVFIGQGMAKGLSQLTDAARRSKLTLEVRSNRELDMMAKGARHQGVIAVTGAYSYWSFDELVASLPPNPLVVALDEITDPHNFGAIVRSAVAFGAAGLITLKQRAAPVTPVVVRASAGATEHAKIARVTNLVNALSQLRDRDFEVIGLAGEATQDLQTVSRTEGGRVLVVGSEGRGLRRLVREHCTSLVRIPMAGPIESLNASVASAVALYELTRS